MSDDDPIHPQKRGVAKGAFEAQRPGQKPSRQQKTLAQMKDNARHAASQEIARGEQKRRFPNPQLKPKDPAIRMPADAQARQDVANNIRARHQDKAQERMKAMLDKQRGKSKERGSPER